jgi:hypothetical protein
VGKWANALGEYQRENYSPGVSHLGQFNTDVKLDWTGIRVPYKLLSKKATVFHIYSILYVVYCPIYKKTHDFCAG